uniref:WGS project CAEQ00000000 data, annotated contig 1735 n=1 Tax=Trypanosoma congolense (strain IL3000) TaxID=1068625 RepID=F9W8I7_TRYCI|nr:unnamed protein product [Trypanosoma congolense IL3000]
MRSRLLVLGSGELGAACALSLLANGVGVRSDVVLAGRDRDYVHDLQHGSRTFRLGDRRICVPSGLSACAMDDGAAVLGGDGAVDAVSVCVPATCLESDGDELPLVVKCIEPHVEVPTLLFTRGFTRCGLTPLEKLRQVLGPRQPKLLVVSGPLFAREWAAVSTPPYGVADNGSSSSGSNNGVTLSFAAAVDVDTGARCLLQQLTERLWWRECVTWVDDPLSAEVLSLVNGCVPLCSMGAGLVSNEYPGSVSALTSYMQHAVGATEKLVNDVLGRPLGTPLPACALSTIAMACTNYAAREFAFGRRLDYHFRHRDALRATFPDRSYEPLDATVAGLHTLLGRRVVSSPFYEVLMDAFLTLLRASVAGRELVRTGHYEYRDGVRDENATLLRHALAVDSAVVSGDEQRFDEARRLLQEAFEAGCDAPAMRSP